MSEKTLVILDPTLRRGFTSIPNCVLFAPDLSMPAKCLFSILLAFAWQDDECWPGQEKLAETAGCTDRTVRKYLEELRDYGLISWVQRGLNQTNVYYINDLSTITRLNALSHKDRKERSGPDRKGFSGQERKELSDKEYSITNVVVDRAREENREQADEEVKEDSVVEEIREFARSNCGGELSSDFVSSLLEIFSAEKIKEKLKLIGCTTGQIRNLPGFLLSALRNDYIHTPGHPQIKNRAGPSKLQNPNQKDADKRKELIKRLYLS
ncbi:MAG: helix-turn-helix domain-containing protein [Peptococcaceae bacterium]|nr:helix-turn-helix domain-containing protein [Peptococcaceae bacterium]